MCCCVLGRSTSRLSLTGLALVLEVCKKGVKDKCARFGNMQSNMETILAPEPVFPTGPRESLWLLHTGSTPTDARSGWPRLVRRLTFS